MQTIALRVKAIIKEKGYKQYIIAKKAGFSPQDFSSILCGRKTFKADFINPICYALSITPNELFGIEAKTTDTETSQEVL